MMLSGTAHRYCIFYELVGLDYMVGSFSGVVDERSCSEGKSESPLVW